MARFFKKREALLGEAPGSLIFVGTKRIEEPTFDLIKYNQTNHTIENNIELSELNKISGDDVVWLNITGIHNPQIIRKVGDILSIHNLVLEDIMNTAQRAKFEEFDDHLFVAMKMLKYNKETSTVTTEQISFMQKNNIVVTFQEEPGDIFDDVRQRIKESKGIVRTQKSNYLLYILIDSIIENYVRITEYIGEKIDDMEINLLESTSKIYLQQINCYKREMNFLIKVIKPVKELLLKYNKYVITSENKDFLPFIRDLQDLFFHTLESVEAYREILNDYLSIYHSNLNIKMNDIMRILTVFSAIFIPITFLAGVYGMNFENLPELHFKYSYYIFWGIVLFSALSLLIFFKHKKWL